MRVQVSYLVDERRTGRTTEVLERILEQAAADDRHRLLYVAPGQQHLDHFKRLLDGRFSKQIRLATPGTLDRAISFVFNTIYLDCADYMNDWGKVLRAVIPCAAGFADGGGGVVVVVEGKVLERRAPFVLP